MAVFFLPLATAWALVPGWSHPFALQPYLLAIGVGLLMAGALWRQKGVAIEKKVIIPLVAWFMLFGLSWMRGFREAGLVPLSGFILFFYVGKSENVKYLRGGIIVAAVGVALYAIKQVIIPGWMEPSLDAPGKLRSFSTLGNPNFVASFLIASAPLCLFPRESQKRFPWMGGIAAVIILIGITVTRCRHAWICLAVMVLWAVWGKLSPTKHRLLAGLAILGIGLGIPHFLTNWQTPFGSWHTMTGRMLIGGSAINMMGNHPTLGVGLGKFAAAYGAAQGAVIETFPALSANASAVFDAHNEFLHTAAESGVFAGLTYVAFVSVLLWRVCRMTPDDTAWAAGISFVGQVVDRFFETPGLNPSGALVFWAVAGMIVKDKTPEWTFPGWVTRAILAILTGFLLFFAFGGLFSRVKAERQEALGDRAAIVKDAWLAERHYRQAIEFNPESAELRRKWGTCLYLLGRWDDALKEFLQSTEWTGDVSAQIMTGEILTRQRRLNEAAGVYSKLIKEYPNFLTPRFLRGQIYIQEGQRDKGREEFLKGLEVVPSPSNPLASREKTEFQKRLMREWLEKDNGTNSTQILQ